jgi:hypothetical protein
LIGSQRCGGEAARPIATALIGHRRQMGAGSPDSSARFRKRMAALFTTTSNRICRQALVCQNCRI